ncbi:MAG: hypothetical protein CME25_12430, partial [Gemmatimonadetes bacterium]|nr:hypothetical protein [Gemmatimonadota bacterium]
MSPSAMVSTRSKCWWKTASGRNSSSVLTHPSSSPTLRFLEWSPTFPTKTSRRSLVTTPNESSAGRGQMTLTELREKLRPPCPALDVHVHPLGPKRVDSVDKDARQILDAADRAGVGKMCIFLLHPASGEGQLPEPTMNHCRDANDYNLQMRERSPDRFIPFCYVNPMYPDESVTEIDRCVEGERMCGIKLWIARRATDPGLDPILQRSIELGIPVLQHAW